MGRRHAFWERGKAWVFDDSVEHEAVNPTDRLRVIMIFDFWHPDLTAEEQAGIAAVIKAGAAGPQPVTDTLEARYSRLVATLQAEHARGGISAATITAAVTFAIDANDAGRSDLTIALLEPLAPLVPGHAQVWQMLALAFRQEQEMDRAALAFERAAKAAPSDLRIASGRALTALETGAPARPSSAQAAVARPRRSQPAPEPCGRAGRGRCRGRRGSDTGGGHRRASRLDCRARSAVGHASRGGRGGL